jgi:hypothetical protein
VHDALELHVLCSAGSVIQQERWTTGRRRTT